MSVWPQLADTPGHLLGTEGALVSVSISLEPRDLEEVLEALAHLDFPINPQIYHEAAIICRYADGREEAEPVTLVEFPAYESRLPRIRQMVGYYGFRCVRLHVADMLDDIHSDRWIEPAPEGAPYQWIVLVKHARAAAAH